MRFGRRKRKGAVNPAPSSPVFVSPFNASIQEKLRSNTLHGLRDRLCLGKPVRVDEFKHVFNED